MYCGCAAPPPDWLKTRYGIDIDAEVAETVAELAIAPLPAELRGRASTRIAEATCALGYNWQPQIKFFRPERSRHFDCGAHCMLGYRCGAKWNAAEYADEAVAVGAVLQTQARVTRVLTENRHVTDVEGRIGIPIGGHSWRGCLGYVRAALELDEQARERGLHNAWVIVAVGTGVALAGLMAGLALSNSPLRLIGIDVGKLWKGFPDSIARLAADICTRLGEPHVFSAANVQLIESVYVGERYGAPSAEGLAAIKRLARLEGIILDPIYTGKAFAGLLDLVESGKLGRNEPVIFLHTGGTPVIFL
ncbi:MAG: pyridoxal-phosphate dependent enzyme [Chloroflexales bacterium]|nr:pyridoxal-phosphate dependent enzyme [Chloroflexales bacterium]